MRFEFPVAKAEYLFHHTMPAEEGGDKQKFWRVSSRKIWEAKVSQFQLFDVIKLKEPIAIAEGGIAPEETPGAIVEVFKNGEAYLVELFGRWVKADVNGDFVSAEPDEPDAFMETIAVETVYPHQIRLVKPNPVLL